MRRLLAVLGRDVSRSLSPLLHGAAASTLGLDVAYVPVSCGDADHFRRAVDALICLGALGANVTIPYKDHARQLATELSATAAEIGAVNTLTFSTGKIAGDNTDGPGLLRTFEDMPDDRFARVQILGAGGAARAAVWAVRARGAGEIRVCARRGGAGVKPLEPFQGATLVISSLPNDAAIAADVLARWIDLAARPFLYDLAYGGPGEASPLVARAREAGLSACDGQHMLLEQAALALAGWTGGEVSAIRVAMRAALAL
jgi:shikimate dehydrogenase